MATSSIFEPIVLDTYEKQLAYVEALEKSEKDPYVPKTKVNWGTKEDMIKFAENFKKRYGKDGK